MSGVEAETPEVSFTINYPMIPSISIFMNTYVQAHTPYDPAEVGMWSLAQEGGVFAKTKVCVGWCAGIGVFTSTGKGDHQGRPSSGRQKSKLCAARRCQGLAVQRPAISLEKGRPLVHRTEPA